MAPVSETITADLFLGETKAVPGREPIREPCAPRRTVDPAIPHSVASPQSRTPLHRTNLIVTRLIHNSRLEILRGTYQALDVRDRPSRGSLTC